MVRTSVYTLCAALTLAAVGSATAADYATAAKRGDLGSPSRASPERTAKLTGQKYVDVQHFETVRFMNEKGQSFTWKFDTLMEIGFPLKVIAPAGFEAGETRVYVRHPEAHLPGG